MTNLIAIALTTVVVALSLGPSGTQAVHFSNSYIQNVKSGRCVTIDKDALLNPLSAAKCNCGPYQFWKMEDGEHVINELALHGYMDELWGKPGNGETVGIYDLTGLPWQKWRLDEQDDGTYSFIVKHTSKCLHQGSSGKIEQTDCDDDDASQKWKVVQNPCGKLPSLPDDKFQLQNPATGMCAVIENDSDGAWAKVVTHKCSCDNNYHYWKLNKKTLVTQGRTKQCLANWEALGHPGVTQCGCVFDAIHQWRFNPFEDGSFQLITQVDGKCAYAPNHKNSPLRYDDCDREEPEQKWRFYDECEPERYAPPTPKPTPPPPTPPPPPPPTRAPQPPNVVPPNLIYFFDTGMMNWLNPTRYTLLIGGHWDSVNLVWFTVDGRQIKPDTDMWTIYFGDTKPSFLSVLFPSGGTWNDVFGWMTVDFFKTWTAWQAPPPPPAPPAPKPTNVIPNFMVSFFNNGQMDWLTPERYTLLLGGRWDPGTMIWYTADGRQIQPSSPEWSIYFGDLKPSDLMVFFPSGGSWDDVFGWMSPTFFQTWTGWQQIEVPISYNIPIVISGYIPTATSQLFSSGHVNWLTPDRIKMLEGGQWNGSEYITKTQTHVVPGTQTWTEYFGPTEPSAVNALFGGPGYWDVNFPWLTDAVKNVPSGMTPGGSFPWDSFFSQMG